MNFRITTWLNANGRTLRATFLSRIRSTYLIRIHQQSHPACPEMHFATGVFFVPFVCLSICANW